MCFTGEHVLGDDNESAMTYITREPCDFLVIPQALFNSTRSLGDGKHNLNYNPNYKPNEP